MQFSGNGTKGIEITKIGICFAHQWAQINLPICNPDETE